MRKKNVIFLIFILFSLQIFSEEFPLMLKIDGDVNVLDDFRAGVEEELTNFNYSLISEIIQEEALKEQASQRKKNCYDEECVVDTGKMLAAKGIIFINIKRKNSNLYLFSAKFIDLELAITKKSVSKYFEYSLSSFKELNSFGKLFIKELFTKEIKKDENSFELREKKDNLENQHQNKSLTENNNPKITIKVDLDDWLIPIFAYIPSESITLVGVEFYKFRWKILQVGSPSILISTDGVFSISLFNCGVKYSFGEIKSHQIGLSYNMFFLKIHEGDSIKRFDFPIELSYRYSFADNIFFEGGLGIFINYNIEDSVKNIDISSKFDKLMIYFKFSFFYEIIKRNKKDIF